MLRARKLLFVVLCFTNLTSEDVATNKAPPTIMYEYDSYGDLILPTIPMLKGDADDRLKIFQYIDQSVSGVSIDSGLTLVYIKGVQNNRKEYRIYLYRPHSKTKNNAVIGDNTESKSMMMYICINCVFAKWVQNKLIEFVEQLPNMYKTLNVDEDLFILGSNELKLHIDLIEQKTRHLINILFNFITVHSYNTYNSLVDMSVLRTLVSTNILIHYISKNNEKSEAVIVNKFLKIVNKFQKYLAFNCDVNYSYYDNKYFFSYSMTNPKTDKYHIDIDEFLNELWEFGLKPKFEDYGVQQMLLGSVLTSNNDVVNRQLNKLNLFIVGKSMKIGEQLFNFIEKSDDLDVIYWYMNIIVDAIIKLFCYKTINELKNREVMNIHITEGFKILSFLFTEFTIDSQEVIKGFNILASNQKFRPDEQYILIDAMEKYIHRASSLSNDTLTDSTKKIPFFKISDFPNRYFIDDPTSSLQSFIYSIINRVSDYKCFINIFELLKIQHEQNKLSTIRNTSKVNEFVNKIILMESNNSVPILKTDEKNCELFINIYEYCVEYCVTFFWDEQFCAENKTVDTKEVSNFIDGIINILEDIYNNKLNIYDHFLIELLLDILPVLYIKRQEETNWNGENNFEIIRILYIIMIELNKYGLEACTSNKYENFFFNNINYNTVGDHPKEHQAIIDEWKKIIETIKSSTQYTLPNLYFILHIFICPGTDSLLFNENIRVNWRGELKTFSQISDNVKFDFLSPYYVYALYDVYFKFHMALLYYNLRYILKFIKYNDFYIHDTVKPFLIDFVELGGMPKFDSILFNEFWNNFKSCIENVSSHIAKREFNMNNSPDPCKEVENIIMILDIDMVLKFPDIEIGPSCGANEPNNSNNNIDIIQRIEELDEYIKNRSNAVELITQAQVEYEKFTKFYTFINIY